MPLSKIVMDTNFNLAPYNAIIGDIEAEDIVASSLDTGDIIALDISCRDVTAKQIGLGVIASPSDAAKKTLPVTYEVMGNAWRGAVTISVPPGYVSPSNVRVKFTLTSSASNVTAYARILAGSYTSPEFSGGYSTPTNVSHDISIDTASSIIIQGRSTLPNGWARISNVVIACDENAAVITPIITW